MGKAILLASAFVGGYVVAFVRSWKLTLVMLAVMPALVISGGVMATFISKSTSEAQEAYASAGTLVGQVVGAIRTVS